MGYYTRVLTQRAACPHFDELVEALRIEFPAMTLRADDGEAASWCGLVLSHSDGTEIAAIERSVVGPGSMAAAEVAEFLVEVADCRPASAAEWLSTFLPSVLTVYAFQHLSGTQKLRGDDALRVVEHHIWGLGGAIIQADAEGFTNEHGYHILWQFSESVSGTWWMAVLEDDRWLRFEMDLGDKVHREHFLAGRVPPGANRR